MISIRRTAVSLLAASVLLASAGVVSAGAAPAGAAPGSDPDASVAYQHDALHDGDSPDDGFVAPLTRRWSTTLAGTIGYPVIADGRVFVPVAHSSGYGVSVEALSLSTGDVLWGPISIGGTYWSGSLAYDDGQVFAINYDGTLWDFDAATGAVAWATQLAGQHSFTSPPTAVNGTVYVGGAGSGGTLYAVDEATGTTTWTAGVANGDDSSPAVDDTGVYVSYACEQAYKFDLAGSAVWHHSTGCEGGGGRTPVLHGGRVYIRDAAGGSPAILDAVTGDQLSAFDSGPAPAFDGNRRVTVTQGDLTVSNDSTGVPIWSTTTGDVVTAPLIVNGYVIDGRSGGTIEARQMQDGHVVWAGSAGPGLSGPDEHNATILSGLAEGDGALVVPAGDRLTVFEPAGDTTVTVTEGPGGTDDTGFSPSHVTFGFTSGVDNPEYTCTLDGVAGPCTSPVTLTDLAAGSHTFSVSVAYATTGAATRTFTVDSIAPTVRVAPFSPLVTTSSTVTAHWSASDWGSGVAAYQLRTRLVRAGEEAPAWSVRTPTTSTSASLGISRGTKRCVSVRARDHVGNWSPWSAAQCVRRR